MRFLDFGRDGNQTAENKRMMRIIAGKAKGIRLTVPGKATRPTADRVREAVFSTLGDTVSGAGVLDLYAGSGALGIEALSRGAQEAIFVEQCPHSVKVIRENLEKAGFSERGAIRKSTVERYLDHLSVESQFELIFADPPYARDEEKAETLEQLLSHPALARAAMDSGTFVLESYRRVKLPHSPLWDERTSKIYGDTRVTFFVGNSDPGD